MEPHSRTQESATNLNEPGNEWLQDLKIRAPPSPHLDFGLKQKTLYCRPELGTNKWVLFQATRYEDNLFHSIENLIHNKRHGIVLLFFPQILKLFCQFTGVSTQSSICKESSSVKPSPERRGCGSERPRGRGLSSFTIPEGVRGPTHRR